MQDINFIDILIFSKKQSNTLEKFKYLIIGLLFYIFFVKHKDKGKNPTKVTSQAGDDIYPLF